MAIMIHITYKGSANNAQLFANEMLDSGIIEKIRKNPGNLHYDYFILSKAENSEVFSL